MSAAGKASSARWWFRRLCNDVRCAVGVHQLRGYEDCGDGVHVAPYNPYWRPGRHCWRKCDWCGATWRGAYDGIAPFWQRVPRCKHVPITAPARSIEGASCSRGGAGTE